MVLRSDEVANQAEVERDQRFRGNVAKGITSAGSLATAAVGGGLAARVLPFLNQYIPPGLAMKGINKVSPKLGAFLQKGHEMGLDVEEGLGFIKDKLTADKKEPAKQDKNIIEQYSPELHQFIMEQVKNGRSPIEAGALATMEKKGGPNFKSIIAKLTKDHNAPWSSILETVYGQQGGQKSQGQQQQQSPSQQAQPNQGTQSGSGQQALMAILAKINQKLGQ